MGSVQQAPSPRLEKTEAALALSLRWVSAMVAYVGTPRIGGMVGWRKPSMMTSWSDGMVEWLRAKPVRSSNDCQ